VFRAHVPQRVSSRETYTIHMKYVVFLLKSIVFRDQTRNNAFISRSLMRLQNSVKNALEKQNSVYRVCIIANALLREYCGMINSRLKAEHVQDRRH
jgi:hypothetical protein